MTGRKSDGDGNVALWRSVIALAMRDATGEVRPKHAVSRAVAKTHMQNALRSRHEARAWLLGNTKDFRQACTLAMLDPDAVMEAAEKLRSDGWPCAPGERVIVYYDDLAPDGTHDERVLMRAPKD